MKMRPLILFSALCLVLSACGPGSNSYEAQQLKGDQAPSKQKMVKQIAWRDLSYTKDTLLVNEERTWNYVFYNTGFQPVRIKQALSSNSDCTCSVPDHEVAVGEQDTVKLHCKFTREGRETSNITVEHDTPQAYPLLILITHVVKSK